MTLDTKIPEVAEKLEELAVMLGKSFLKEIGNRRKIMSLYGHEPEVLDFMKRRLEKYFSEKGEDIAVQMGKGGYAVDVDYFI